MRRRSHSRLTGSLVLLTAGVIIIVIAIGASESVSPIAILLGGMAALGGVIGLIEDCR